jgi:hypothetical protein
MSVSTQVAREAAAMPVASPTGGRAPSPVGAGSGGEERHGTVPGPVLGIDEERRGRALRRVALGALTLFVLAGLSGLLGVRTRTARASSGPLDVALEHAVVARPALAVPYRLTIHSADGFDQPIEVRITSRYLEAFDENGAQPEPDGATTDEDETVWEFDPPEGTTFVVWLDTRIEPGAQWRVPGRTTVASGDRAITIEHPMWGLP